MLQSQNLVNDSELPQKTVIAVVTDNKAYVDFITETVGCLFKVCCLLDSDSILSQFRQIQPAIIFTDENGTSRGGRDLSWALRRRFPSHNFSVVVTISQGETLVLEGVDPMGINVYLKKPFRKNTLINVVSKLISKAAEEKWQALPELPRMALIETAQAYEDMRNFFENGTAPSFNTIKSHCEPLIDIVSANGIKTILDNVRDHDDYSYAHSLKVATLLVLFGLAGNMSQSERLILASGGLLHDVGKLAIPLHVLNKPGQLTAGERKIMESHVTAGSQFLSACDSVPYGASLILAQHHEKIDGSGYPRGLRDRDLNELARMAAIVDIYSALTDRRVYKPAMSSEKVFEIMTNEMSGKIDVHFLRVFKAFVLDAKL